LSILNGKRDVANNGNAAVSMPETVPLGISSSPVKTSKWHQKRKETNYAIELARPIPRISMEASSLPRVSTDVQQLENRFKARTLPDYPVCQSIFRNLQ
jgi:hypothetical protein